MSSSSSSPVFDERVTENQRGDESSNLVGAGTTTEPTGNESLRPRLDATKEIPHGASFSFIASADAKRDAHPYPLVAERHHATTRQWIIFAEAAAATSIVLCAINRELMMKLGKEQCIPHEQNKNKNNKDIVVPFSKGGSHMYDARDIFARRGPGELGGGISSFCSARVVSYRLLLLLLLSFLSRSFAAHLSRLRLPFFSQRRVPGSPSDSSSSLKLFFCVWPNLAGFSWREIRRR